MLVTNDFAHASCSGIANDAYELRIVCNAENQLAAIKIVLLEMTQSTDFRYFPVSRDVMSLIDFDVIKCLRIADGLPETLALSLNNSHSKSLLWRGDREYWLECEEKCSALQEAGAGHQYLIVRNRGKQTVEISYNEQT